MVLRLQLYLWAMLMLFWNNKCRIENKKVFIKLTPVLINRVISPINHTQHLAQCLDNRETTIGYGSSESKD